MNERRTARRYDLSLPIIVRAPLDREAASGTGTTQDISTRGVYFTIENNLSSGTELHLTMIFSAKITGGTEVFIRTIGTVVRIEKQSGNGQQKVGVAASFDVPKIVRNNIATV